MAYTQEEREQIYTDICRQIAEGKSLRQVLASEGKNNFPSYARVMVWLKEDADFQEQYARAREEQADFIAQEILEIADAPVVEFSDDDEGKVAAAASRAEMDRRRLQIDARKWMAGKLKPKVYGDKLNIDGDLSVKIPDDQLESRVAHLIGKAGIAGLIGGEGTQETSA